MSSSLIYASQKRTIADLFVAGYFEKEKLDKGLERLEPEFCRLAAKVAGKSRFPGKFAETFSSYSEDFNEGFEAVLFGLGQKKNHQLGCMRKAAGHIAAIAKQKKAARVRIWADSFLGGGVKLEDAVRILAEVIPLARYEFSKYKKKADEEAACPVFELLTEKKVAGLEQKLNESVVIAEAAVLARDLNNEPGNIMHAVQLAKEAEKLAEKKGMECRVLDEAEIKKLKMGGILAVNQGSKVQAQLIILEYGSRFKKKGTVCLVGKGVTFDTGGISIKPSKDMEKMKYDKSGAIAVLGAMSAVADLKLPLHVVAIIPAVENMVAKNPQRPGDIIRMYNGKTVEVLNTDAEGRLILADALAYAERYQPKAIVDIATLTGMCAYTFGPVCCGVLGTNQKLIDQLIQAGKTSFELAWQLPLFDEYAKQIKGHHSDLLNIGGPYGGTITATMFLKEFVPEKTAWAHLDIAGTAWTDSPRFDCPKGATGFGVKLLTHFLMSYK